MFKTGKFKKRALFVYLAIAVIFILLAVFAGSFAPYDPLETDYSQMLQPPSSDHLFGTDQLGRDIFSRILYGGRTSLLIAFLVTFIVATIGILLGTIAGFRGGIIDSIIMRVCDVLMAFPGMIFVLVVASVLGVGTINLIIAMTAIGWTHYARVSRSLVLSIRTSEYIEQAKLGGATQKKIVFKYILPNVIPSLLVLITHDIGSKLLMISGLSLLGLGSQPPTPEWGFMLSEGRDYWSSAPWMLVFPGLVVFINVVVFNLLGDSLRDIMDPHHLNDNKYKRRTKHVLKKGV